ncbi:MAG: metallophosphoesterase [Nanoarchaeota archaeon]
MRLIGVSDLHIGRDGWNDFGIRTARAAAAIDADILYFVGDLAEPNNTSPRLGWERFEQGLEALARSSAPTKLFTLGNNDLEHPFTHRLTEHYTEIQEYLGAYGFRLLDDSPVIVDGIAFVGNIGWYDGTLWQPYDGQTRYPNDAVQMRATAEHHFHKTHQGRTDQLTTALFSAHCHDRLTRHLDQIDADVEAIVLGTHFVPHTSFVTCDDPRYTYLNWYMGSEGHAAHYQRERVILGLTGHTHRSDTRRISRTDVHNLSGPRQPRVFDIQRIDGNHTVARERYEANEPQP